jgi:hypothetical protein
VTVLGGAGGAAGSARVGASTGQRLGGLLANTASRGLEDALRLSGLTQYVGQTRFDVLDGLITMLAGNGEDEEAQAARDAVCDVIEELFGDAESWEDLVDVEVTVVDLEDLLERFLGAYVYNRLPVIAERLAQQTDPTLIAQGDQHIRALITEFVSLDLPDSPLDLDWMGADGRAFIEQAIIDVYEALEDLA